MPKVRSRRSKQHLSNKNRFTIFAIISENFEAASSNNIESADLYTMKGICLPTDETDQAIEEPDEIVHINRDSESKYEKSDRHETFELN
ncbi:hypothetical protein TNCV_349301 [Trichonephila clavipes]|nr:hypothetical protein TNCV_349301 [Trichonephila clavipes]